MDCSISRNRLQNWRTARVNRFAAQINQSHVLESNQTKHRRRNSIVASNFVWALLITIVIILTQLFIVHHYFGHPKRRRAIFSSVASREANLLAKFTWFCHSFTHLNNIAQLANELKIDLLIIDPDLLSLLLGNRDEVEALEDEVKFGSNRAKPNQEANEKTIIHLAAINGTSSGQPNLRAFLNSLKRRYHLIEYHDVSETMPAELYKRQLDQLDDDTHADAIKDSVGIDAEHRNLFPENGEISKVYTEFATHIFIVNTSYNEAPKEYHIKEVSGESCSSPSYPGPSFVVLHLFVIYNYEFQPDGYWMQSSLLLNEIDRHKLLTYGVHMIDFRVPLDHYYIHRKRGISTLLEAGSSSISIKRTRPLTRLKVLDSDHIFHYVNNSYLNCRQSSFNISALMHGSRKMSSYLMALDFSRPLGSSKFNNIMLDQLSVALQFMNVLSRNYGNFNFWFTGSTLLAYHKFCQLIALTQNSPKDVSLRQQSVGDDDMPFWLIDDYDEQIVDDDTIVELDLGLLESELDPITLKDLSEAGMIGVTLLTDWRDPKRSGLVSFRIKDCPNFIFNLYFYRLVKDLYGQHYVTNNNMIYNYKFRRRRTQVHESTESTTGQSFKIEHHVFSIKNLELCWTRLDRLEPFRVPCDIHDHLYRIYVQ